MELTEIINEALKLPKKDKTKLVNAVLESMSGKGNAAGFVFPVFRALNDFCALHMEFKGTGYKTTKADFRWMKQLLEHIYEKIIEGQQPDTIVIDENIWAL